MRRQGKESLRKLKKQHSVIPNAVKHNEESHIFKEVYYNNYSLSLMSSPVAMFERHNPQQSKYTQYRFNIFPIIAKNIFNEYAGF